MYKSRTISLLTNNGKVGEPVELHAFV